MDFSLILLGICLSVIQIILIFTILKISNKLSELIEITQKIQRNLDKKTK